MLWVKLPPGTTMTLAVIALQSGGTTAPRTDLSCLFSTSSDSANCCHLRNLSFSTVSLFASVLNDATVCTILNAHKRALRQAFSNFE